MIELQTAVESLMDLILGGGEDAAKTLFKGMVVKGADQASAVWRSIFEREPETFPLADRVARNSDDSGEVEALRALLEKVLAEHPDLLPPGGIVVVAGDIKAETGSVAAAVITGNVTINNK